MAGLGGLGYLAGGLAEGIQSGADLRTRAIQIKKMQMELDQEKRNIVAESQAGAAGLGGLTPQAPPQAGSFQGPGAPSAAPAPMTAPGPAPVAQPQMQSGPAGLSAPPPGAMPTQSPTPLPSTAIAQGQGGSGGVAPPSSPVPPAGGGGAVPQLSGVAQPTGNYTADQSKTLGALYTAVKRQNPNIQPGDAFRAVNALVEQMKGVAPEDKIALQAQNQILELNYKYMKMAQDAQTAQDKVEAQLKITQEKLDALQDWHDKLVEINKGHDTARVTAAGEAAGARVQAAGIGAGARVQSAKIGAAAKEDVAAKHEAGETARTNTRTATQRAVAETNRKGRENAAAISNGKDPPHPDVPMAYDPKSGKTAHWDAARAKWVTH